jgi:hypothetical protein
MANFLKVWWPDATLFYFISFFFHTLHSHILTSLNIRRGSSPFPHRWSAQWQTPPWGAESGFELGPALQRADMLPTEPCRTLLSHAAPYWAMPHPNWAMANFTCMWRRAQLHFNFHLCMTPFISACRLSYPILLLTYTSALRISSLHDTFHLYMTIFIPTWRFLTLHAGFISAYMFSSLHDTFHLCVSPFTSVL